MPSPRSTRKAPKPAASVDTAEVAKFTAMAEEWWDEEGKFKPLHQFNPVRIGYIRDVVAAHFGRDKEEAPLKGLTLLDVGCGGGLLCEPMTRLGAKVTGMDASEKNIKIAALHAKAVGLTIDYRAMAAEELAKKGKKYDVVLAMEIIEHVADVPSFMAALCTLVKPGGLLFVATLNRTARSFALAIVGAEYVLRWLPKGTHDWKKFPTPAEVEAELTRGGLTLQHLTGVRYDLLRGEWSLCRDVGVNYVMVGRR